MTVKREHTPFILASKSPRREFLFKSAGIEPKIIPSEVKEEENPSMTPAEYAKMLAYSKACDVAFKNESSWVLGADTIVVVDGKILGKPQDMDEAKKMIFTLSGNTHEVITGFSFISPYREKIITDCELTKVTFRRLSMNEMEWYIKTDEPYDKAGGYGIQKIGAGFIERIEGSYTNVVGLPLNRIIEIMQRERLIG